MNLKKIEAEALHLSREERSQLIQRLVLSLDSPSEDELKNDWLNEAKRRADDIDSGNVKAIAGSDVMKKAHALVK